MWLAVGQHFIVFKLSFVFPIRHRSIEILENDRPRQTDLSLERQEHYTQHQREIFWSYFVQGFGEMREIRKVVNETEWEILAVSDIELSRKDKANWKKLL